MAAIHSYADARRLARRHLPWMVFDYIDGAADDDQVLVDHRRRVELEVAAVDRPDQILAQVDHPVVTERSNHLTGLGVETEQAVPARQEDPERLAVPPHRHAPVPKPAAERRHPVFVRARIEDPVDSAGVGHASARGLPV